MKVSELIKELMKFNGDEVVIVQTEGEWLEDILIESHVDSLSGEDECIIVCEE